MGGHRPLLSLLRRQHCRHRVHGWRRARRDSGCWNFRQQRVEVVVGVVGGDAAHAVACACAHECAVWRRSLLGRARSAANLLPQRRQSGLARARASLVQARGSRVIGRERRKRRACIAVPAMQLCYKVLVLNAIWPRRRKRLQRRRHRQPAPIHQEAADHKAGAIVPCTHTRSRSQLRPCNSGGWRPRSSGGWRHSGTLSHHAADVIRYDALAAGAWCSRCGGVVPHACMHVCMHACTQASV
jgi:hypothetical protein